MDRDYHEGVDALQADMARHQREFAGVEVTSAQNRALAVATVERLEKEAADVSALPPVPPAPVAPPRGVSSHTVEDRKYTLDKAPDVPMFRTASEFESQVLSHAQPRLERLMGELESGPLGAPSWRARAMAAMYFKVKSLEARKAGEFDLADNYERAYQLDLSELLESSSAAFGDWRKDAPVKLIVSG